jgi:DNA polymerase I-like protein with 3'-5' exonuclease and polymerase domains
MIKAYNSGDPYLKFAKQAGAIPEDATKQSHKTERNLFKACALAVQYGMGAKSLANRIGSSAITAKELLRLHRETYQAFWQWSDSVLDYAMLNGKLWTVFGWTIHLDSAPNPRSLRNFPMQANGAEMLRIACFFAVEKGIKVCAPIHDAILIEAPVGILKKTIIQTQKLMAEASSIVLNEFELRTDYSTVCYPDRYMDERGQDMWNKIWVILKRKAFSSRCA